MNNYDQDKTVQTCVMITFSLGVVAVLVYMLTGSVFAVYSGLGIYAFSFLLLSLFAIRKLFVVASYKERLSRFEAGVDLTESDKEIYNQKKEVAMKQIKKIQCKETIKAIVAGAVAIFAVVVLVLF